MRRSPVKRKELAQVVLAPTSRREPLARARSGTGAKARDRLVDIRRFCRHSHISAYFNLSRSSNCGSGVWGAPIYLSRSRGRGSATRRGAMNNYLTLGRASSSASFFVSGRLPDNAAVTLNGFVVHISLPALTLAYVHNLHLNSRLILPALVPWIMFGLGCAFFWLLGRALLAYCSSSRRPDINSR